MANCAPSLSILSLFLITTFIASLYLFYLTSPQPFCLPYTWCLFPGPLLPQPLLCLLSSFLRTSILVFSPLFVPLAFLTRYPSMSRLEIIGRGETCLGLSVEVTLSSLYTPSASNFDMDRDCLYVATGSLSNKITCRSMNL